MKEEFIVNVRHAVYRESYNILGLIPIWFRANTSIK